ncbi:ABC transporter substrate-binding protein [Cellulomonas sp. NPDC057328]|uniref:ABC transporter substrate-binding protein n=1 Tax=Cellulomonas sp. NPDC057328 TaxID=3346101 RepID=UPI00363B56BE
MAHPSKGRRSPALIALISASALALAGCASPGAAGPGGPSSSSGALTLTVGATGEADLHDPIMDSSLTGYSIYYHLFDYLTRLDADGTPYGSLATDITSNDDFTEWTFTIRTDTTFHNGDPVTIEDVAYSYETVLASPESRNLGFIRSLEKVEVVDDETLRMTLSAPMSAWQNLTTTIPIVPEGVYSELGSEGFAAAPVGSGPYRFVRYTSGVEYVVEKFSDYHGPEPELDQITFQVVADEDARVNGVASGTLGLTQIPPNQAASLDGSTSAEVVTTPSAGVVYVGVAPKGILADKLVRQAIWRAIDQEALVEGVLGGGATVNDQLTAPSVQGFVEGYEGPGYDPAAAKALLQQAGYDGEPVPFQYATSGWISLSNEVAQVIGQQLQDVGLNVQLEGLDPTSYSAATGQGNADGLFLSQWAPSTMDADNSITGLVGGGLVDYFQDPAAIDLVVKQRGVDGEERLEVFREIAELNADMVYKVPLYTQDTAYAVTTGIEWAPRADGLYLLTDVTRAG